MSFDRPKVKDMKVLTNEIFINDLMTEDKY